MTSKPDLSKSVPSGVDPGRDARAIHGGENGGGAARAAISVQQTLAEQMRITNLEIESRKRLLGIGEEDVRALISCRDHIGDRVDEVVEEFYNIQTQTPEIALVIGDVETLSRLRRAMRAYILEIFGGCYDAEYVNKRLRIGKVHTRIGVSPKLYTTALYILNKLLEREVDKAFPEGGENLSMAREALNKVLMFDIQLVFDTYISGLVAQVEAAKDEVEAYAANLEAQVIERTQELARLSLHDRLTGLYNQAAFFDHLRREIAAAERSGEPLSLAYMDLNEFKSVNDTQGHRAGDRALILVAEALRHSVREADIVCRYGGDEFCVIMPRTHIGQARLVCERIINVLDKEEGAEITLSVGVAQWDPAMPMTADDLVKSADHAMYRAKDYSKANNGHMIEVMVGPSPVHAFPISQPPISQPPISQPPISKS